MRPGHHEGRYGPVTETERQRQIITMLETRPFATVRELIDMLSVSPATVRRDIEKLHEAGEARKVFGGVASLTAASRTHALPFAQSSDLAVDAKRAIAAMAADLCRDGDMVMVAGGSTCHQLGLRLAGRSIGLYTNSMPLAAALGTHGACQLSVAGGALHREPGILYDPQAAAPDFFASRLFLGAQGLGLEGVMESHPLLPVATRPMLERADDVIVLADSRKLSVRARFVSCPIDRVSTLITDDGVQEDDVRILEDAGVTVLVAPVAAWRADDKT
ncbi:putative transcriptional regulator arsR [Gluconacetobacter diazotrophicus PA1 5]|uniref:Putative transcriptional regulator arsR n=1 Tax=Gluconacetobacter diazotrophicus (strain ATCC 49037 / DSM 5601 / CCUG 37298 / CIP 103539 / LMG 7603 / PAl5) TaxID=272568 RepID=A9HFZ6_GLUDA|nr:putative transcriptional regulator arsR [Gluconacetobacter diazotrophicus PA1 5]